MQDIPLSKWFCSAECDRIHVALERFVLKGPLAVPWSLITMMKSKTRDIGLANETRDEVQWQLLNGQHIPVSEKLFVKAISIFEVSSYLKPLFCLFKVLIGQTYLLIWISG